jgi:non-specific serine/threonine protein kinase
MDEGAAAGMPTPLTPILGRDREVEKARSLLTERRLLTVVGAGGCGKTRLAIEAVADAPDVVFVDLAPLDDPGLVLPTIARALGLREAGAQPVSTTLLVHLRDRRVLLLLDNLEHLLDAAAGIADLLARCPAARVLATSRSPLRVPGEQVLQIDPLPVPDLRVPAGPEELLACPSVALLVARVRAVQPDFALSTDNARAVAEICHALDGLPLALELAAAQVRPLGVQEVLARARQFRMVEVPSRAVPDRHRSLANAVAWSVALLDAPATRLFRRLSVFVGGWTAHAAQQVCGEAGEDVLPAMAALVEHSLVDAVHSGTAVRYRMLETLRKHSATMARDAGDHDIVRRRHAESCRSIASRVGLMEAPDEAALIDEAEAEFDNFRAALDNCPDAEVSAGLQMAADLYYMWDIRGYLSEGREHLRRLLDRHEAASDPVAHQAGLQSLGLLLLWQDEHDAARAVLREGAALAEDHGDPGGWAWCAGNLAISHFMLGDIDDVVPLAERGLEVARAAGALMPLRRTTCGLGLIRWAQGRRAEAVELLEENARLNRSSMWGTGKSSYFLGWIAFVDHNLDEARDRFRTGATAFETIRDCRSLPDCLDGLACVAAARDEHIDALRLFTRAAALRERAGSRRNTYLRSHCDPAETRARSALATTSSAGITPREHEVARLIAEGFTNRQIGNRLGISERTAERHAENLRGKLGVRTRAQVAAWVSGTHPGPARPLAGSTDTGVHPQAMY